MAKRSKTPCAVCESTGYCRHKRMTAGKMNPPRGKPCQICGATWQCTHKHVAGNKRWADANRDKIHEQQQRFYKKHRTRVLAERKAYRQANAKIKRAHTAVRDALRRGILTKQPCEVCGERAVAHHDDYSQPLNVRWLCTLHHRQWHSIPLAQIL